MTANVIRLAEVAKKQALNFGLETKTTNTKPTLIKPKTAFLLNQCYNSFFFMNIDVNDIVIANDKRVQYLGKEMDNGAIVQDIHCRKEFIHVALIQRKATKDESKWFCEKTENSQFTPPSSVR